MITMWKLPPIPSLFQVYVWVPLGLSAHHTACNDSGSEVQARMGFACRTPIDLKWGVPVYGCTEELGQIPTLFCPK